jgi:hypothetical protein
MSPVIDKTLDPSAFDLQTEEDSSPPDRSSKKFSHLPWSPPRSLVKVIDPDAYNKRSIEFPDSTLINWASGIAEAISRMEKRDSFRDEIAKFHSLVDLPEDWDDNGAPAFSKSHWKRVSDFLLQVFDRIWQENRAPLLAPTISPVSDGSIDIHWKTADAELLINVPSEATEASFYGDNLGKKKLKGSIELEEEDFHLLVWLNLAK